MRHLGVCADGVDFKGGSPPVVTGGDMPGANCSGVRHLPRYQALPVINALRKALL